MRASIQWLNKYLDRGGVTPDVAEHTLTATAFPIESRDDLPNGDAVLDVEVTSNRGDCLCHVGLARELGAALGLKFKPPAPDLAKFKKGEPVASVASVANEVPTLCPRFTARVIRGVKVGPSPKWLVEALEAVGQRSINNIVDVSNYVLFELGHPSHAFDLNTLAGKKLIVRHARAGEALAALDGRSHKLLPGDLVVADAEKAVSLAGVVGGRDTGVTEKTTDVLLEVATWHPATIRKTARRLGISTDAGYRFERIVDARDLEWASARCAELILELAGGTLCDGMIDVGVPLSKPTMIEFRPNRCVALLGIDVPTEKMVSLLGAIGVEARPGTGGALVCRVPHHRPDLLREIDLIEEVARLNRIDNIPVASTLNVRLDFDHPQDWATRERAAREIASVLTGAGFYETVTFSFLAKDPAKLFTPKGVRLVRIDEERRKDTPWLRPSAIPSLLACAKANHDAGVRVEGGIRLYEVASVFGEEDDGKVYGRKTIEHVNVAMVLAAPESMSRAAGREHALRSLRGVIESLVARLGGPRAKLDIKPCDSFWPAFDEKSGGVTAGVSINDAHAGYVGLLADAALNQSGLASLVACAEINFKALVSLYPPSVRVEALPSFPAIERDLSLIVPETSTWASIDTLVRKLRPPLMEESRFVTTFRGKPIPAGKKSVTLRLVFRDPQRTLRHEEVDPQMGMIVNAAKAELGAELREVPAS